MRRKTILSYLENKSMGPDPASNLQGAGEETKSNPPGLPLTQGDKHEGDLERLTSWNEFFEQLQPES